MTVLFIPTRERYLRGAEKQAKRTSVNNFLEIFSMLFLIVWRAE
jgi:hypothetical protein